MSSTKRHHARSGFQPPGITVSETHINVDQKLICITEDKARLCFHHYLGRVQARQGWVAPAGILIAVTLALVTADFKNALGLSGETWKAAFVLVALLSLAWLVVSIVRMPSRVSPERLLEEMRTEGS